MYLTCCSGEVCLTDHTGGAALEPTILQAALAQGLPWPSRCRVGSCTTCRCRLLEGDVRALTDTSYVLSREQLDQRYVLACQSQPKGRVRVHLDRMKATLATDASSQPAAAVD